MFKWQIWIFPTLLLTLAMVFWHSETVMEIGAGIAIFLLGMRSLETGFQKISGGLLEKWLNRSTDNMAKSITFGVISTSVMQSSSLVSLLCISFISAGMISLYAGLGIIFGANLGTTSGAWLMAAFGLKVKLSALSLPLLIFGTLATFQKARQWQAAGHLMLGVGFLFLGIHFMKTGFAAFQGDMPLDQYHPGGILELLLYSAIGIVATVIMQSSHATLVLIITALAEQHISYDSALALAIGANVGTTITAIIGSFGANKAGKQLALGHLLFNIITGLTAIICLPVLLWCVDKSAYFLGYAQDNYTMKLAIFHTLFNSVGILLMVPWSKHLQTLLETWIPNDKLDSKEPKFLHQASIESYTSSLAATRQEAHRLHQHATATLMCGLDIAPHDLSLRKPKPLSGEYSADIIKNDYHRTIKPLSSALVKFIAMARAQHPSRSFDQFRHARSACHYWAQTVKTIRSLHPNLYAVLHPINGQQYSLSHPLIIAYQDMRYTLFRTLQIVHQLEKQSHIIPPEDFIDEESEENESGQYTKNDYIASLEVLDKQQQYHIEWKQRTETELEDYLRKNKITAEQATALMSHYGYARYINRCLILAARHWILCHMRKSRDIDSIDKDDEFIITQID